MRIIFALLMMFLLISASHAGVIIDKEIDGYVAYVPKLVDKNDPIPLLVVLPGLFMSGKDELNSWKFYTERNNMLVIGIYVDYSKLRTWVEVEQFYQRIINVINLFYLDKKNYTIDRKRIFIAGTSAGGMVSMRLSLEHPGRFRGTAVVSGSNMYLWHVDSVIRNAKDLNFLLVHGRKDNIISINDYYVTKEALEKHGANVKTYINESVGHNMQTRDYERAVNWMTELK